MRQSDLSQSTTNLWGRTIMDYIKYYSKLRRDFKMMLYETAMTHSCLRTNQNW